VAIVAIGAAGGVLLAIWLTPAVGFQFRGIASREIAVSWRVIGAVSSLALACAWICGSLAALVAARRNVTDVLRRSVTPARRELVLRRVFVTGVVALAFVLIAAVTLVGRSLLEVLDVNPGFIADGVLTMNVAPPPASYPDRERLVSFYTALQTDLEQRLGHRAVGIVDELPLTHDRGRVLVGVRPTDPEREAVIRVASTGYFDVMRIPLVAGRGFDERDNASAPPRIVISRSLAERLFARESPVGRQIYLAARAQPAEVIGIVGDVKHRALDDPFLPTVYLSAWQAPSRSSFVVVRTARSNTDTIAIMRESVVRLDRNLPVSGGSMPTVVAESPGVPARRVLTLAFTGFALLAVVLGGIGLFGVVAHDVATRRAELALRIALGANTTRILTTTLGQGVWMVGSALVMGGVLSFWTSRALSGFLVTPGRFDVVNVVTASAVLMLVGVCAVLPAARRAARTDPLIALRGD
jgi:predicted permease